MPGPRAIRPFRPPRPEDDIRLRRPDLLRRLDRTLQGGPIAASLRPGAFELPDSFWDTEFPGLRLPPKSRPISMYLPTPWEPGMGPWGDPTLPRDPNIYPFAEALRSLPYPELLQLLALRTAQDVGGHFEDGAVAAVAIGVGNYFSDPSSRPDSTFSASRRGNGDADAASHLPEKAHEQPVEWLMGILEDGHSSKPGGRRGDKATQLRDLILAKTEHYLPELLGQTGLPEILRRCAGKWFKTAHADIPYFEKLTATQWKALVNALADKIKSFQEMGVSSYTLLNSLHRHSTETLAHLIARKYPWTVISTALLVADPLERAEKITDLKQTAANVARRHPDPLIQRLAGTIGKKAATRQDDTPNSVRAKARKFIEIGLAVKAYIVELENPTLTSLIEPILRTLISHGPEDITAAIKFAKGLMKAALATSSEFDRHTTSILEALRWHLLTDTVSMGVVDPNRAPGHTEWWLAKHVGGGAIPVAPTSGPDIPSPTANRTARTTPPPVPNEVAPAPQKPTPPQPLNGAVPLDQVASFLSTRFSGNIPSDEVVRGIREMLTHTEHRSIRIDSIHVAQVEVRKNGHGREEVVLHIQFSSTHSSGTVTVRGKVAGGSFTRQWVSTLQQWIHIKAITVTLFD